MGALAGLYASSPGEVGFSKLTTPVAASTTLWGGGMVCRDAGGFAVPASNTSGLIMIGKAQPIGALKVDNSAGADGDKSVVTLQSRGQVLYVYDNDTGSPLAQDDIMKDCYVVDDHTIGAAASNSVVAGKFMGFLKDSAGAPITSKCLLLFPI